MKRRIVAICAVSLLSAGVAIAVLRYWLSDANVEIGAHGYIAIGLGVGFTVLLAFGLMSLVYFSARRGYDEAADQPPSQPLSGAPPRDSRT